MSQKLKPVVQELGGVLQVISARRGEFETGFERGGQTREHAMLVKTAGVRHLVIVVNKMDDPTVEWEEARCRCFNMTSFHSCRIFCAAGVVYVLKLKRNVGKTYPKYLLVFC